MDRSSDHCLQQTLELTEQMLRLADEGDAVRDDPGCGVLYGMLRDAAYKLRQLAEAEQAAHLRRSRGSHRGSAGEERKPPFAG